MLAFIALAIAVAAIFSLTGVLDIEEADKQYFDEPIQHKECVINIDEKFFEYLKDLLFNGKNIPVDEKIIPDVKLRKRLTKIQTMYNEFQGNLQKIWDALNVLEGKFTKNLICGDEEYQ
uniref:Uncharacterized protein n=1 Tax=Panagrolaimus sp. PS1159 TaxID=55785 RepID=A0AC35GNB3_9BILA